MDLSTGVPSIGIPIYEIQVNEFTIPISLSYHASGNKVDDIASVAGLGWALNAGGCISRSARGLPDEVNTLPGASEPYVRRYKTREELMAYSAAVRICELYNIEKGIDLESDIYSFNFNGYGGQFMFNKDNAIVLSTYDDLKISGGPRKGFLIYTPDGTSYRFFDGDSMVTNSVSYKTCWYLNQIITPNADTINFKYKYPTTSIQGDNHPSFNCKNDAANTWKYIDYTEVRRIKYLDQIIFKNGSVIFNYGLDRKDMRPHRLTSIEVKDYNNKVVKKVNFGQSYFVSAGADPNNSMTYKYYNRLKLDNVSITDPTNSASKQTYAFEYNTTTLPPYFMDFSTPNSYYAQDYWGYYNGATTNTHLIPIASPCNTTAANRNCNETAMQATILRKIIFPTGGRTEFEYAANTNRGGGIKLGGLRIMKIKSFTDNVTTNPSLVKTYEYVGGGFTTNWVKFGDVSTFSRWFYLNLENGYTYNYTSAPNGNITFSGGSVAIYERVKEYSGEQQELMSEYYYNVELETEYTVPSSLSTCAVSYPIIYPPGYSGPQLDHHFYYPSYYKEHPWRSGQLTRQIDYKKEGTTYTMVRDVYNTWTPCRIQDNVIVGLKLVSLSSLHTSCPTGGDPDCVYQYFNVLWQTGVKKLTRSVETLYATDGNVAKTTDYEYGMIENAQGHGFLTKEILTNSAGDKVWTNNRYLPEVFASPTGVYLTMKNKNMIGTPLEVINGKTVGTTNYYLNSTVYNFNTFNNLPKLYQVKILPLENPSTTYTNWSDSRLKTEITFDSYDKRGNMLNATPTDNIATGYLWGYRNSYPVAKVQNAKNVLIYTNGTATEVMTFPSNTFTSQTKNFTTTSAGNMTFTLAYSSYPGTGNTANFTYALSGPSGKSGSLCTHTGTSCGTTPSTITFTGMPAGNYRLIVTPVVNSPNSSSVRFTYSYQGEIISSSSITEFYYQGFEEYTGATATTTSAPSYAGRYYKTGNFTVPFVMPNSRSYTVEYHYWDGTRWVHAKKAYTNGMTLSDGTRFDEVRVYPADALMTTYTYDPLVGMTSSTDEKNVTTYYEYDNFGRVKTIKDDKGNILKTYDYHYAGQTP